MSKSIPELAEEEPSCQVEADLAVLVDLQAPSLEACGQDAHVGPIDLQEVQVVGLGPFAAANVEAFLAVRLSENMNTWVMGLLGLCVKK